MGQDSLRIFWAVRPSDSEIDRAAALAQELRAAFSELGLKVSWTDPASLHVTLKFLGDVKKVAVPEIVARVESWIEKSAFLTVPQLYIQGIGAFPGPAKPRVIFAEVHGAAGDADLSQLYAMQASLEDLHAELGHAKEERPFTPHLTLGRVRDGRGDRKPLGRELVQIFTRHGLMRGETFSVDEIILYESRLSSEGARHVPLYRLPLGDTQRRT